MLKQLIDAICFRLINGPLSSPSEPQFQIEKLYMAPSDILVVRVKGHLSLEQAENLKKRLAAKLPLENKIIVIEGGMDLAVLSAQPA